MSFRSMPGSGRSGNTPRKGVRASRQSSPRRRAVTLEFLEDRTLLSSSIPLNSASWTPIGPAGIGGTSGFGGGNGGPASGRISGVAGDPTNPNVIYAATSGGGVWRTTDAGVSWKPLTDGMPSLVMGSIAVSKSDPNTIYAGTGQADNAGDSFYGRGILKSTDGGTTWTLVGAADFNRKAVTKVAINPTDPRTVYVSVATPDVNGVGGNNGIWKSTDGGTTWTNTTTSISTNANYTGVVLDVTNPLIVYAAVGSAGGSGANGVYKSTDGGLTWSAAGNFPNGAANGRIELAIGVSDTKTLVASVSDPATDGLKYLMKTTDAGVTWTNLTAAPNYLGGQGSYDNTVAIDPTNSSVIFAAGVTNYSFNPPFNNIVESRDGGNSFFDVTVDPTGGQPHTDEHASGFDASGHYLVAGDGGIWRLENPNQGSLKWTDINSNLQTVQFVGAAIDPLNANIALGGSQDNGTERFNDNIVWKQVWGGDGGQVGIDPTNDQIMYTENYDVSFRRSDDGGASFQSKISGIGNDPVNFYAPFTIDPSNPSHILYGTNHVYTTNNRGDSWTALATPGSNGYTANSPVNTIAISASDPKTIYVATDSAQIFVSTDGGANWTQRNIAADRDSVTQLEVDPTNPKIVYATRGAFNGSGGTGHIFKSIDGGLNWNDISSNLPDIPSYSVTVDTRPGSNRIYVGTDNGVWASSDAGATWAPFKTGMPNAQVTHLILSTQLNTLLASTYGRGMFEIIATDSVNVIPQALGAVEGVALTNVQVATFTDSSSSGQPASAYTATIAWGDGTPATTGIVSDLGGGTFGVTASHTYAEEGSFKEVISITSTGGTSGQSSTTVVVADAPLTPTATTFSSVEGQKFTGVVGLFSDGNKNAPISDFTASIDWGDGHVTTGTLTAQGNGVFSVSGSNTYKEQGSYQVKVSVVDIGGQSTTINSTASVSDAPLIALPVSFNAVVGTTFSSVTIASFQDTAPGDTVTDYSVQINWGDGTTSQSGDPGVAIVFRGTYFDVTASHTYQHYPTSPIAGQFPVNVTVTDEGGASVLVNSTALVTDAAITATSQPFSVTEGQTYGTSGVGSLVATFTSTNPFALASDFAPPTIDWGDAAPANPPDTTTGVIQQIGSGKFGVYGSHTYAEESTYFVKVSIASVGGSLASATSKATVLDASISAFAPPTTGVAGTPITGIIGTFTDSYLGGQLSEFTATVDWGDGTIDTLTSIPDPGGHSITQPGGPGTVFLINDSHTYASPQVYPLTITVSEPGGAISTATASATVADAPFSVTAQPLNSITEGGLVTGAVATFNTTNTLATASDYIAQIDWGDGSSTGGLISPQGLDPVTGGLDFSVSSVSPHAYTEEGVYQVTVTVTSVGGGVSHSSQTTANVADATIIGVPAAPVTLVAGTTFNGVVGSFKEYAQAPLTDFTASIDWGNGVKVPAIVSVGTNGAFNVSGSNTFPNPGNATVTIYVTDVGGSQGHFTVGFNVTDVPIVASGTPIAAVQGTTFTGTVATFTQSNQFADASQFLASINWGDGSRSNGVVTGTSGSYTVTGTHLFAKASKAQPVTVTITHVVNGQAFSTATVSDVAHILLPVVGAMSHASDTGPYNNDGITQTRTPIFSGTGEPGTTVQVFAAPSSKPASTTQIGSAVINSSGQWILQTKSLADGSYVISANEFDPGTGLTVQNVRLATGDYGGPLVVWNTGPTVAGVTLLPQTNQLLVAFNTSPAMMYYYGLVNPANYTLAIPTGLNGLTPLTPTKVSYAMGSNSTMYVALTYAQKIANGSYVVELHAAGLIDLAGNILVEKKLVTYPQSTNSPNPDYVAQLDVSGSTVSAPHQYISLAERIAAGQYSQYVQGRKVIRVPNVRTSSVTTTGRSNVPQGPSALKKS